MPSEFWPTFAFAGLLAFLAVWLMAGHVGAWRRQQKLAVSDDELEFFARQYNRRMWSSGLIGVVGLTLIGGVLVERPYAALAYWGVVMLLLMWIAGLAAADWLASRSHFLLERERRLSQRKELEQEIESYMRAKRDREDAAARQEPE